MTQGLVITMEAPRGTEIAELIKERLAHSYAHSPPESVHALPLAALDRPDITFWTARLNGQLVGCAVLLRHEDGSGELKSMYLRPVARGSGLSKLLLAAVETKARGLELSRIDLETGTDSHAARAAFMKAPATVSASPSRSTSPIPIPSS